MQRNMPCAKRFVNDGVEFSVVLGNVLARTLANPDLPARSLTPISAPADSALDVADLGQASGGDVGG